MEVKLEQGWKSRLKDEFEQPYFKQLATFVRQEYTTAECYPPRSKIFAAFDECPFDQVKVVILGQDPYHGPGQANGLCFSVNPGISPPPSLINIFKEIENDLQQPRPGNGDLTRWARQGVLLLNATLTVRASAAGSHQNKGWETFTDAVVHLLNEQCAGLVFVLWGNYAQRKGKFIDPTKHLVLTSAHPSPLSAHNGFWNNHHFSKTNAYLEAQGKTPIQW